MKIIEKFHQDSPRHFIHLAHSEMHLYGSQHRYSRKKDTDMSVLTKKTPPTEMFTLTALVALVSMTGFPTFRADELHTLQESTCFHIEANKIPEDTRCSCLRGGRFCLTADHWVLEYDPCSPFWLGEDGLPRAGFLIRYTGFKKGGRSVTIGDFGERICCVEQFL